MKYSKQLKFQTIRFLSNRRCLLLVFMFWFFSAVCVSLTPSYLLLASQMDRVFKNELSDRAILQISPCDLKFGFSEALGLPLIDGVTARRGPANSSFVEVDIDLDGDVDLIELSRAPRILVWVNDGRGRFFPATPNDYTLVRVWPFFYESAENDFLSVWLEPHELCLDSVTLSLVLREIPVVFLYVEDNTPRSPRAPPASTNKA